MSSKKLNPKLRNDKNTKHFPSIQIYTKKKLHQREGKKTTIKQPPIILVKYSFITIATYSLLQDCSTHILPTYQILYTYNFIIFIDHFIINEFTFYILHPNIL